MDQAIGPVMALDVGERRIGIAVSDPLGILATPLMTLERRSWAEDLAALRRMIREREVVRVIVGHPVHMNGRAGEQARHSERFAQRLAEALGPDGPPVELWDERLSTQAAARRVRERGGRRRVDLDAAAAAVILQEWLEAHRRRDVPPAPDEAEGR